MFNLIVCILNYADFHTTICSQLEVEWELNC